MDRWFMAKKSGRISMKFSINLGDSLILTFVFF